MFSSKIYHFPAVFNILNEDKSLYPKAEEFVESMRDPFAQMLKYYEEYRESTVKMTELVKSVFPEYKLAQSFDTTMEVKPALLFDSSGMATAGGAYYPNLKPISIHENGLEVIGIEPIIVTKDEPYILYIEDFFGSDIRSRFESIKETFDTIYHELRHASVMSNALEMRAKRFGQEYKDYMESSFGYYVKMYLEYGNKLSTYPNFGHKCNIQTSNYFDMRVNSQNISYKQAHGLVDPADIPKIHRHARLNLYKDNLKINTDKDVESN